MKGISDVVAMLLMLVITIGLVGVAYSYIMGVFTSRTAVALSQDGTGTCQAGATTNSITFWVRNDGTSTATSLTWADVPGNPSSISGCTFNPTTIPSGSITTVTCSRSSAAAGYYQVRISAAGATPIFARVYCSG
jgi:FlaG/FlaF family flagellin (archaellin)